MNSVHWLVPIYLPRYDREALAFAPIAIFDCESVPLQYRRDPMERVAVPRHRVSGRKMHATYERSTALEKNFIRQINLHSPYDLRSPRHDRARARLHVARNIVAS